MGDLDKLAVRQLEYRALLRGTEEDKPGGMTLEEEAVHNGASRYKPEAIVNLAVILEEVYGDPQIAAEHLHDSVAILDHLDTLGMEVRFRDSGEG